MNILISNTSSLFVINSSAMVIRSQCCMLGCFSHVLLFATLWTVAHQEFCPWNSPGKNTRVGSHSLLRESCQPRDQNWIFCGFCIAGQFFSAEPSGKPRRKVGMFLSLLTHIASCPSRKDVQKETFQPGMKRILTDQRQVWAGPLDYCPWLMAPRPVRVTAPFSFDLRGHQSSQS